MGGRHFKQYFSEFESNRVERFRERRRYSYGWRFVPSRKSARVSVGCGCRRARRVAVDLQNDDAILRDDHSREESGWLQAELGLPANINVIARGGQFEDAKMYGGGLRVGLFTPSAPLMPAISVSALYDKVSHDYVEAHTWSANAVLSVDVPFIHPYLGVGWDRTDLKPTDRAFDAAPTGTSRDLNSTVSGYRAELGVNISVIPFTYLNLGVGSANSKTLYHAGIGAKF